MKEKGHARPLAPQMPDCTTCILRKDCEQAEENSFCTKYKSRDGEIRLPDPNDLWMRGEEVEF